MALALRPYQSALIDSARESFRSGHKAPLLVAPCGSGKCLGRGTPVLKYSGLVVPVEEIVPGALLMGPDSKPRRVLSVCSGKEQLYRIAPIKGDSYIVNESHVLSLKMSDLNGRAMGGDGMLYSTGDMANISVRDWLSSNKTFRINSKGWRTGVDFEPSPMPPSVDPYFLGVWLGDGASRHSSITTGDDEISSFIFEYARSLGMSVRVEDNSENSKNLYITLKRGRSTNPLWNAMKSYRLHLGKHIPYRFKTGSRQERLLVLAGLLDTDGYLSNGVYDLTLSSERLFDDALFLIRSLGFAAYKNVVRKTCTNNGVTGTYYRCSISGHVDQIPCRIARKKAAPRRQIKNHLLTGISVEPIGIGDYYGFELDGDGLFLLGDFTVTHNTVCFSYFAQRVMEKGKRVLILAHRDELLDQISTTLGQFDVPHSFVAAGRPFARKVPVQVASVFTLVRRLDWILPPDLIIIDEAHHAILGSTWNRVLSHFPSAHRIGVTATPERLSGEPLKDVFDDLILGPTVKDLISIGSLAPYRLFAPASSINLSSVHVRAGDYAKNELVLAADKPSITGDAIAHYQKLAPGKQAIAFCVSIDHAKHVAAQFRSAGYESVSIDGNLDRDLRRSIIRDFREKRIKILTSCDVISEGFDVPGIEVAIMLRPTASLALWIQQSGRALRPAEGKDCAIILDHAGNTARHGLPDEDRAWSLNGRPDAKNKNGEPTKPIRTCPMCFAAQSPANTSCVYCKHVFEVEPRKVEHIEGELVEIDPRLVQRQRRKEQGQSQSFNDLVELGKQRGYKRPYIWARYVWGARQAKKVFGGRG